LDSFCYIKQYFQISQIKLYLLDFRFCNFYIREEALKYIDKEIQLQYISLKQKMMFLKTLY